MGSSIRISFNHPLASFPIDLKATSLNIHAKPVDRGGTCYDWLETASTGSGMQGRVAGRPTEFFSDHPFDREDERADPLFYAGPRFVVQDINQAAALAFESGSLDAVMIFSNRWFPPKAVRIWKEVHEFERMGLVLEYLLKTGSFENLHTFSMRGLPRPETDKYIGQQRLSDPVYAVWGRKR